MGKFEVPSETAPLSFFDNYNMLPGSNFFENTPLFFRYSGVNATNAANFLTKRRKRL